jgi:hypothetical protein
VRTAENIFSDLEINEEIKTELQIPQMTVFIGQYKENRKKCIQKRSSD